MPNPVVIPPGPLSVTDAQSVRAETLVSNIGRLMAEGSSGASTLTPATLVSAGINQVGVVALKPDTKEKQLFLRQVALALSKTLDQSWVNSIRTTSDGVTAGKGVRWSTTADRVIDDDNTISNGKPIGVAPFTVAAASECEVVAQGKVTGLTGLTAGTDYYLGDSGTLVVYGAISSGRRVIRMGYAMNSTTLWVAIQDLGQKA